jgi:hypothetical protein
MMALALQIPLRCIVGVQNSLTLMTCKEWLARRSARPKELRLA